MAGKKSAKEVMDEWQAKVDAESFSQLQADMKDNAYGLAESTINGAKQASGRAAKLPGEVVQGAMNAGNKLGAAMEGASVPGSAIIDPSLAPYASAAANAVQSAGTGLRQGIYDMRTGGEPKAPYPDAYGLMTDNANAINSNMKPPGMMPRDGQTGVMENQIISELQQLGVPITPEAIQQYMQYKAQAQQGLQGAGQAIQGAVGKGMDVMRGLLQ